MATAAPTQTCYRHPDRETGVSCSSCGRPICPSCMTPTPVGMRCPECARQKTEVRTLQSINTGAMPVTIAIIVVNVVMFLASGFGSIDNTVTQKLVLTDIGIDFQHHYYTLASSGFLHAGPIHILFNMYLLYVLGQLLEPAIGSVRFALIYAIGLFAGSAGALLTMNSAGSYTLGASGAVFGLMGAAFFEMRNRGMDPMAGGIGPLILFNLVLSFVISNISIGGHIGGLIGGSLAAIVLHQLRRRRLPQGTDYAVLGALVVIAFVAGIAVAKVPADAFSFG